MIMQEDDHHLDMLWMNDNHLNFNFNLNGDEFQLNP